MSVQLQRRLFTVDDYYQMAGAGILGKDDRIELLEGEIVHMSPAGSRHSGGVNRLSHLLVAPLSGRAIVGVQNPLRLNDFSEPEPDLAICRFRDDYYAEAHPQPEDVHWLIEVSDTSLAFDREVKLPLYAVNNIPEVWVVDIQGGSIDVYRGPAERDYRERLRLRRGDTVASQAFPELELPVVEILGAA